MTTPSIHAIVHMLEKLPKGQQKKAVKHLQAYLAEAHPGRPKGKTGRQILKFAGIIDKPALKQMEKAIEAGCEQVDGDEW